MKERVVARVFDLRRKVAVALLVISLVGYPTAWSLDPFLWGVMLLTLAPMQIAVAVLGIVGRLWRDPDNTVISWLIDSLLLTLTIVGYAFARTISWS